MPCLVDEQAHGNRKHIELMFNRLKHCCRAATRCDKTISSLQGLVAPETIKIRVKTSPTAASIKGTEILDENQKFNISHD